MSKTFDRLGAALDRQSYQWLLDSDEEMAGAVEAAVQAGATPDEVRRFVLAHAGSDRHGLAARAMSAARWLKSRVET